MNKEKKKSPIVSVVIPSYNHRPYVIQAIESVLDQSWPQVDLIVIDDGSTDGSPEAIEELWKRRGGFRFIARENQGLIRTLNEGLSLAEGEFFCELASDDWFPADSLERRVQYLQEHPECVVVFGDGFHVKGDVVVDRTIVDERRRRIFFREDPIPDMLDGALPVFSTGLIRREAMLAIGGFDDRTFRYYEDLDTPIFLSLQGRFGFVDTPVIFHREHATNISSSTGHIRTEKVLCYQKLLFEPKLAAYRKKLKKRLRRSFLALGRYLESEDGGTPREREVFCSGWSYVWRDPRILWYLLKWNSP